MITASYIPAILVVVGIASDNLMLSAMSGRLTGTIKPGKLPVLLFMLLNMQMVFFKYGNWLAKIVLSRAHEVGKWMALSLLAATAVRMYQELRLWRNGKIGISFGLNGFVEIALATSVYVFVSGFSLSALEIPDCAAFLLSMTAQAIILIIGWSAGKGNRLKVLPWVKKVLLVMMVIGIVLFIIQ
ncbi:hypothetical protein KTO58_27875 [Chitinophaga pendula]|uniref:hypothetical protein n=1 Tax=Chitinophaga TaxID=79328 RepID=UPI000BAE846E|nr:MULTISPECIES: hypothetical protein [Chitinophaga]ASZ09633.1 hypothetical protein CK934_00895 [Chitinophaga sp. MD30]UCJ07435.1 hypothetical protein KTO58_27875 [Chitinophaga pendula]